MVLKNIGKRFRYKTVKVAPKQNSNPEQPKPEQPESKSCIGKFCKKMTLKKRITSGSGNDTQVTPGTGKYTQVGGKTNRRKRKTRRYRKR